MFDDFGKILLTAAALDVVIMGFVLLFGHAHWLKNRRISANDKTGPKTWSNYTYHNEVHTVPDNDIYTHEYEDCGCSPKTHPVPREDGSMGWQVVHNAMDGRPN